MVATSVKLFRLLVLSYVMLCHGAEASHEHYHTLDKVEPTTVKPMHRTAYHFQPKKNWMNDPNAPMFYKGVYHLFYQFNPYGAVWGNIVWAHAVSMDLIRWIHLKPAIYPSAPFDINGCWSGSATILPDNTPVILYTGLNSLNQQVQNLALPLNLSDPFLVEWIKPVEHNPLMVPSQGLNASSFRDPTTAWLGKDGHWRVLVGSKRRKRGLALLYRSRDFKRWVRSRHVLHSAQQTGMWECPDFFPVAEGGVLKGLDGSAMGEEGVKHVLKVSLDDLKTEYYTLGHYVLEKDKYEPDKEFVDCGSGLRFDYGKFYASKTFYEGGKGRRILWGWINESDSVHDDVKKGWSGVQGIPRSVWLDKTGRQLVQWPVAELETLRGERVDIIQRKLNSGSIVEVPGVKATQVDVEVTFDLKSNPMNQENVEILEEKWFNSPQLACSEMGTSMRSGIGPFGLLVLASKNLEEHTAVFFRVFKSPSRNKTMVLMCSDQRRSSLGKELDKTPYGGFVDVDLADGKIFLRTLVDHSIVESFGGGGRTCITARVYPELAIGEDAHLYAFNYGSVAINISKISAWNMGSAV
ncbi:beta-fructofuranosidase, insoluble isoenzyme 1 isoform X1 [Amborella trichopoda]|nr:beta-fructofuranosidase, insoluble isoenzyme 1 isoform X1 [Amborella trichopoda]|eukprot:XP_011623827.2 beta-fructofuranosidase, insoluble isoenzyme 1 isoform X1 [Amborella trichopoda]